MGSLQSEAYRLFGYTPMRTSKIAQRLYLDALISYPRTGSQKLSPSIGYESILKKLSRTRQYKKPATELLAKPTLKPTEGKKEDSAHPAIYPTGNPPERALDAAGEEYLGSCGKEVYGGFRRARDSAERKSLDKHQWKQIQVTENKLWKKAGFTSTSPSFGQNTCRCRRWKKSKKSREKNICWKTSSLSRRQGTTPAVFSEKWKIEEIGTKATRAGIIQTLYDRNTPRRKNRGN